MMVMINSVNNYSLIIDNKQAIAGNGGRARGYGPELPKIRGKIFKNAPAHPAMGGCWPSIFPVHRTNDDRIHENSCAYSRAALCSLLLLHLQFGDTFSTFQRKFIARVS